MSSMSPEEICKAIYNFFGDGMIPYEETVHGLKKIRTYADKLVKELEGE